LQDWGSVPVDVEQILSSVLHLHLECLSCTTTTCISHPVVRCCESVSNSKCKLQLN